MCITFSGLNGRREKVPSGPYLASSSFESCFLASASSDLSSLGSVGRKLSGMLDPTTTTRYQILYDKPVKNQCIFISLTITDALSAVMVVEAFGE